MYSDPMDGPRPTNGPRPTGGLRAASGDRVTGVPLPPAWRLAGEDDDTDDHPHILRGVD